jgi:hypothetical protein
LPEDFAKELLSYLQLLIEKEKIKEIYLIRPNLTSSGFIVESLKVYPFDLESIRELLEKIKIKTKEFESLKKEEPRFKEFQYILEPSPEIVIKTILKSSILFNFLCFNFASTSKFRICKNNNDEKSK